MLFIWFLLLGALIGLVARKIDNKREGDFIMKQDPSVIKAIYKLADMIISPSAVEDGVSVKQTRLQKKLVLYHSIFKNCQTVDEIIEAFIEYNNQSICLNTIEVELLRYYLQFSSKFQNQTWIRTDLIDKISLALNNNGSCDNQSVDSDSDIFATFIINDRQQNSQYKKEPIKRKENREDSIYDQFAKMRRIRNESLYYIDNEYIFIKQGKFMEEFTDGYKKNVPFQEYYPTYSSMSDEQLRTYFTWRTRIRNGELLQTSLSYIFVYIYELINNIGVKNPIEGIEKLSWLLKNHSKLGYKIEPYLVEWIKDYYICNEFSISFKEIVERYKLEEYYPTVVESADNNKYSFSRLRNISKYKIENSKFYTAENEAHISNCFDKVISNLIPLLSLYGTDLDELISGEYKTITWWKPFRNAIYRETKGKDKEVIVGNSEIYKLKDGQWLVRKLPYYSDAAEIILGYIIKKIESDLRVFSNYRYKLYPNIASLQEQIQGLYDVSKKLIGLVNDRAFEEIIDETIKLEFSTNSLDKENAEKPLQYKKLIDKLNEEPYLTFIKLRKSDELKGETNIAKRFRIQAGILDHLSDNFGTIIPFYSSVLVFDVMTIDQLRCYITWRTEVRNGKYPEIPLSYIHLYITELLNKDGEADEKIIENLAAILRNYGNLNGDLRKLLTVCIKDYYISGDISKPFYEVLKDHKIIHFYPNILMEYTNIFYAEDFRYISNYDIFHSKFYSDQTARIINNSFKYVFEATEEYFSKQYLNLRQMIAGVGYANEQWRPFKAIHCDMKPKSNRRVVICSNEVYSFKDGKWICELMPQKSNTGSILVGYMLKRMEVNLRTVLKFKYKLSAEPSIIAKKISDQRINNAVENPAFSQTIDDSVMRFLKNECPRVFVSPDALFEKSVEIKIDQSKLNKIREDAEIIRDKLAIDDDSDELSFLPQPEEDNENTIKEFQHYSSPLKELYSSMTELQKNVLEVIINELSSMSTIMELAQEHHVMPEILLEEMNEMALTLIGDNLIETAEENPYIYDEYLNEIKMCLEEKDNGKSGS